MISINWHCENIDLQIPCINLKDIQASEIETENEKQRAVKLTINKNLEISIHLNGKNRKQLKKALEELSNFLEI